MSILYMLACNVALRKESVDRNIVTQPCNTLQNLVALRKESVDRNFSPGGAGAYAPWSLSARRAWIEM